MFGIVKQSGGDVGVQSEPGRGTTFTVTLPRVDEGGQGPETGPEPGEAPGTETVLVVEDERAVGRMVAGMLRQMGYRALVTADAAEALKVAAEHPGPIDLVLSDVVMPGCRGPALVERLRQVRRDFKVLYMSGYADGALGPLDPLVDSGVLLQKPFTPQELARKIRGVLGAATPGAEEG